MSIPTPSHVNTLALHRLHAGELDPAEAAPLRAHLDTCPRCSARWQALQAQREAFVLQPVPPALRTPAAPPAWRRWLLWGLAPALALGIALVVVGPGAPGPHPGLEEGRTKGAAAALEVWLDTPQGPKLLHEGDSVAAGDTVQLRFDPGPHRVVTLAGRDGRGAVEVYGSTEARGGVQTAPFALTLDDTPGDQVFYALFTVSPPAPEAVRAAVGDGAPLPDGTQRSIRLRKR